MYFKKLGIKVVKTMAQASLGIIGTAMTLGEVNWIHTGSAVLLAGIICILMNLKDLNEDDLLKGYDWSNKITDGIGEDKEAENER